MQARTLAPSCGGCLLAQGTLRIGSFGLLRRHLCPALSHGEDVFSLNAIMARGK